MRVKWHRAGSKRFFFFLYLPFFGLNALHVAGCAAAHAETSQEIGGQPQSFRQREVWLTPSPPSGFSCVFI